MSRSRLGVARHVRHRCWIWQSPVSSRGLKLAQQKAQAASVSEELFIFTTYCVVLPPGHNPASYGPSLWTLEGALKMRAPPPFLSWHTEDDISTFMCIILGLATTIVCNMRIARVPKSSSLGAYDHRSITDEPIRICKTAIDWSPKSHFR